MKVNVKAIFGQNLFDRVGYIVLPPKVVLLDFPKYLVGILVSLHHTSSRPFWAWFLRLPLLEVVRHAFGYKVPA